MERISKNSLELKQKVYSEKIGNFVNFDFFNLLMETSPDYIFVKDSNLCFIAVNKRAAWALGVSDPSDAIGKSDIDFFQDIADMTRAAEQQIIETGGPQIDEDINVRFADGSDHWVSVTKLPLKDDDGRVMGIIGISRDITERMKLERSLQQESEQLQTIFDTSPNCMYIKDKSGRYLAANKAIADLYQTTPEDMIGKTDVDFAHQAVLKPAEATFFKDIDQKALETKEQQTVLSEPFTWSDRTIHYFHTRKLPITFKDDPDCVLGISMDITEEIQKERKLKENEQKLMSLIDSSTEWIWQVDINGIYQFVSGSVQTVIGYHPSEVIGKTPFDFMTPEEAKRVGSIFSDILERKERISKLEDVLLKKNGKSVYFETDAIPLLDDNGDLLGYFGVCRDITKRKESEGKLKESIERYKTLFDNNVAGVGIAYADGKILSANESMCRLLDYSYDEFLDLNVIDLYVQPDERQKLLQIIENDQIVSNYQVQLYTKNKKPLWVNMSIKPIDIEGKPAFLTTAFDITDIYTAREQLKLEQSKLLNIFNGMNEVIFIADTDTHELLYLNESAKKFWGDRIGEKCYTVLQHRDTPCPFCSNSQIIRHPDKTHIWEFQNEVNNEWFRCIDRLIPWTNGKMVRFELAINITDIKKIQREISDKNDELHQQNIELNQMRNELMQLNASLESIVQERTDELEKLIKMKDDFIEQLGHDLKNPLGPLMNLLPLLEKHSSQKEDEEIFTVLKRNVDYMKNLVKKTLYFI